jgi:hypothetical protein
MSRTFDNRFTYGQEKKEHRLERCAYCGMSPDPMACPSGIEESCVTLEEAIYRLITVGMSEDEAAENLFIDVRAIAQWKYRGELARDKMLSHEALTENDELFMRFARNLARRKYQLRHRLQALLTKRAAKGEISTADAIKILERLSKESWGKHDTLTINDNRKDAALDVIAPVVAMIIRSVLDGLSLSDPQREIAPALVSKAFEEYELEATDVEEIEDE